MEKRSEGKFVRNDGTNMTDYEDVLVETRILECSDTG